MFSVLFEVRPDSDQWDDYLDRAKMLRPELEQIEGFIDNVRYRSLMREGWILSVSVWRDEKALVRWRTSARHHGVQAEGRAELLQDYRLRVGQITDDTDLPAGYELREQRLDESEIGPTTVVLTTGQWAPALVGRSTASEVATWLGLDPGADGLESWEVFDAVLEPGDVILMTSWSGEAAAEASQRAVVQRDGTRTRRVRVIRDYGLIDRREAPQYYPDVSRSATART
jgi:heme-degrading monooxygenase HmoA